MPVTPAYASGAAVLATGQPGTATVRKIFENPRVAGIGLAVRIDADDPRQVAFDWAGSSPRKERAR